MNVMKEAHKATKAQMAKPSNLMSYRAVLRVCLRHFHDINKAEQKVKAMQAQKTVKLDSIVTLLSQDLNATGFGLQGVVTDSEGNQVNVGEYSGSEMKIQNDADYYMSSANGFSKQELFVVSWGLENAKESFKIIR